MLSFFFFNDTATTEIYTLSLHDALPIYAGGAGDQQVGDLVVRRARIGGPQPGAGADGQPGRGGGQDRKSTRLNSSHANISYAVFCLKKKNNSTLSKNLI